jgi:biopolymer transport protein ExbD
VNFKRFRLEEDVSINLVSLIDVLFILIIFFMVSTTFTRERQLSVELPKAQGESGESANTYIEVVVGQDGEYAVNDKRLVNRDPETLEKAIRDQSQGDNSLPFLISADAAAPYQSVVTVMDVAGKLGFSRLRLPTNELQKND